jgi:hypothetical protein
MASLAGSQGIGFIELQEALPENATTASQNSFRAVVQPVLIAFVIE